MVSTEEVIWAYRLILGREPESEAVVNQATACESVGALVRRFISSDEYRVRRFSERSFGAVGDRLDEIRTYINKGSTGIEIGPWFNPICPKREGYATLVLDVFDQAELVARAKADPGIDDEMVGRIEPVDIVGSVSEMDELLSARNLAGTLDYVVSSHNFEHVPDPVRFLRACQSVLNATGILSMAVPDRRTCFDHFRPYSTTGEIIEAFWARRSKPSPAQIFSHVAFHAKNHIAGENRIGWGLASTPAHVSLHDTITNAYDIAHRHLVNKDEAYFDTHCWTFSPRSLELIIMDLNALNLIDMAVRKIIYHGGHEFYIHIEKSEYKLDPNSVEFREKRSELLRQVVDENAEHVRTFGL
ncbi:methyltransferase domain-containing protein [Sphingobium yanoikuyae]|uniref:Methyltransferase domain-containing protein n=1 Tax=Sphingobium yanoikuyae TaxID=13690 RepID=A0A6P1GKU9_SPHYA|nr:methyltransferase domain-containing protein [Sphingobium yanoikuyae]QHD69089.1 methyltransferase domain-containing protein [Sphingobium yanoikuyae]